MQQLRGKRISIVLQIGLIAIAAVFLFLNLSQYPLTDYDEAVYAKIVVNSLESGNILSPQLGDEAYLDKPPLYYWLAMLSVKIFGVNEVAFRLPSVIMAIICLWLIWLITKRITRNNIVASFAFLVLLFSPPFYVFSREMRLDSGVVMFMLLAFLCVISGWRKKKYLLWVGPALALGFLMKSFIVALVIPIIFIYSWVFKKWEWLRSRYLYWGSLMGLVIILPWHVVQSQRFGHLFWDRYFLKHVFQRTAYGISDTAKMDYLVYLKILWEYYQPWMALIILLIAGLLFFIFTKHIKWRGIRLVLATFLSSLFILLFFTFIKTHISAYIYPVFPWLALLIALSAYCIFLILEDRKLNSIYIILLVVVMLGSLMIGAWQSRGILDEVTQAYHYEQKELGLVLSQQNKKDLPLYLLDWPFPEAIDYYGQTVSQGLNLAVEGGQTIQAPFYLVMTTLATPYFYDDQDNFLTSYEKIEAVYEGLYLVLIYSERDLILPILE